MTIEIIDTIRVFLETEVFGSTLLFALFIILFCAVLFFLARVDFKIILVLLLPLFIQLGISGIIPIWIVALLLIGGAIVWALTITQAHD